MPYHQYIIREARPADMDEIIQLCAEHAAYEQADYDPAGKPELLKTYLFSDKPRLHCLIAELQGEVLGYATYMFEFSTWDAGFYVQWIVCTCVHRPGALVSERHWWRRSVKQPGRRVVL